MYNPHTFACERNNSSRIRKQEVGFRLSEGSSHLFSLEEKEKEKEKERKRDREETWREESES